jgi:hypothetical protein
MLYAVGLRAVTTTTPANWRAIKVLDFLRICVRVRRARFPASGVISDRQAQACGQLEHMRAKFHVTPSTTVLTSYATFLHLSSHLR